MGKGEVEFQDMGCCCCLDYALSLYSMLFSLLVVWMELFLVLCPLYFPARHLKKQELLR